MSNTIIENKTIKGQKCMRWDNDDEYQTTNYPLADLKDNYCRNPDNEKGIYCFIDNDENFEYCEPKVAPKIKNNVEDFTRALQGLDYRGYQNKTRTGKTC